MQSNISNAILRDGPRDFRGENFIREDQQQKSVGFRPAGRVRLGVNADLEVRARSTGPGRCTGTFYGPDDEPGSAPRLELFMSRFKFNFGRPA